jgi:flagellar assembly protein FliH
MNVEAVPLRLARTRTRADSEPVAGKPAEDAAIELARQRMEDAARQGHEQGMRAGYEEGVRKGLADAQAEVRAAVDKATAEERALLASRRATLEAFAGELRKAMGSVRAAAEDEMVALCFETLCRMLVVGSVQEQAVREKLLELAGKVRPGELVALHVHPAELAWLDATAADDDGLTLPLVGDPDAGVGGCIVKCRAGGLDARLETMLVECKAALLQARARRASHAAETP